MFNLSQLFDDIRQLKYCVIKCPADLPVYKEGTDIDILCFDSAQLILEITDWFNKSQNDQFNLRIKTIKQIQRQLDIVDGGVVHLKFDIYSALPEYKKVILKPAIFESIIENSTFKDDLIKIPSDLDEAILRYVEFVEYYNTRPDKIKHLDYIIENVDPTKRKEMLEKLHHYTALPSYPTRINKDTPLWKRIFK